VPETGDRLPVLVERYEVDVKDGAELLLPNEERLVVLTFEGRVLGSNRREFFAVAFRPADAAGMMRTTVQAFEASTVVRDAFGRQADGSES
jgi:hypothetical protein